MPSDDPASSTPPVAQLDRREERFRLLVEQVVDYAIFLVDPTGNVASWNKGAQRIKQYTDAEVIGKRIDLFYTPEDRAAGKATHALTVAEVDGSFSEEGWRVRKDGTRFWAAVVITALRDEVGNLTGFAKVTRDLTARRQAEETAQRLAAERAAREQAEKERASRQDLIVRLEQSVALLDTLIDAAPIGIAFFDPELRYMRVNRRMAEINGLPAAAHMERRIGELFAGGGVDVAGIEDALRRVLETGTSIADVEIATRAGDRAWLTSFYPVAGRGGGSAPVGVGLIASEITEQRRAERLLRRQARRAALRAEIAGALSAPVDDAAVLGRVTEAVVRHLDAAFARVWLLDEPAQVLRLRASAGIYRHLDGAHANVPVGALKIGRIAAEGVPHVTNDVVNDPWIGDRAWAAREGMVAFAGFPLVVSDRMLGVLAMFARQPLGEDVIETLGSVADTVAHGLERRRVTDELRASRDQLGAILSSIAEAVVAQGPDGGFLFANEAAARLTGFADTREMLAAPNGILAQRFQIRDEQGEVLPLDEMPGRRALRGTPSERTVQLRNVVTGEVRWMVIGATPVIADGGKPVMAISIFRDVTGGKRTEEAWRFLAEASAVLGSSLDYEATLATVARLAVPHIADWCSVEISEDGSLPPKQLAVAHVDPAKVALAHELRQRFPPRPDPTQGVGKVITTGEPELIPDITDEMIAAAPLEPEQRRLIRELGLRSAMTVPMHAGGRTIGAIVFVAAESGRRYTNHDLVFAREVARRAGIAVENARLYREAQEAVKVRDTFLTMASHELKTPLTSLGINAQALLRDALRGTPAPSPDRVAKRAHVVQHSIERITRLINQLLDVSRISNATLVLAAEPVDLGAVVREVVERMEEEARRWGSRVEVHGEASLVGTWDPVRVEEVFTNLFTNALKYGNGKPIDVTVARRGDRAVLSVADHGMGIPSSAHDRIFQRFERLVSEREFGGFGLGLWIVRALVDAMGGTVAVTSEVDQGATFTVELPLGAAPGG